MSVLVDSTDKPNWHIHHAKLARSPFMLKCSDSGFRIHTPVVELFNIFIYLCGLKFLFLEQNHYHLSIRKHTPIYL